MKALKDAYKDSVDSYLNPSHSKLGDDETDDDQITLQSHLKMR